MSHNEAAVSFKVRRLAHQMLEGHTTLHKSNDYFDETLQEEAKQVRSSSVGSRNGNCNAELSFEAPKAQ
jgi:rRNA-processing protein FCF1